MNTPSQEIYNEMKSIAIQVWSSYDNTYGYVTEKINYINSIKNIQDNAMVFYRMFDNSNQETFRSNASNEVLEYIKNNK
jgi:cystathionine beta-lyase family protein involved in aluminum resistance